MRRTTGKKALAYRGKGGQNTDTAFLALRLRVVLDLLKIHVPNIIYHCHHKHYRPAKILSELIPASLDWIITEKYSKRICLIVIRAHYPKHLAVHRSHDTRTKIQFLADVSDIFYFIFCWGRGEGGVQGCRQAGGGLDRVL